MSKYTNDPLYTAILSNDFEEVKRLKAQGVRLLSEVRFRVSVIRQYDSTNDNAQRIDFDFQQAATHASAEEFVQIVRTLHEEVNITLYILPEIWKHIKKIMFEEGVWECVLDCFSHSMNKTKTMQEIINANRADLLAVCAKHGWLSQPKKRDEMIAYATENGRPECTAWLLEFKNKNFDLAAERAKAEKKAKRELNAAPDSVTALKRIWSYNRNVAGEITITGYKGNQTEVVVPERIGSGIVIAIGRSAFCPFAPRITPEIKEARKAITKITLPETIRFIGKEAFWACENLRSVNIPEGVKIINEYAFTACGSLEKITIPSSVKCIEKCAFLKCESLRFVEVPEGVELINEAAFAQCKELTELVLPASLKYIAINIAAHNDKFVGAVVPRRSTAEEHCKRHNIPFTYKEDKG